MTPAGSPPPHGTLPASAHGGSPPTPPSFQHDLELLVLKDEHRPALTFWLSSGPNNEKYGPVRFESEPQEYFAEFFHKVKRSLHDRSRAQEKIAEQGAQLGALLPDDLMSTLLELRKPVRTMRIQSEEAWIPWELLKLEGRDENGRWIEGPFLCEAFALTRWRRNGKTPKCYLPLSQIALVATRASELPAIAEECRFLHSLSEPERQILPIPPRLQEVRAALARGEFDGWHFTGHGAAPPGDPNHWPIVLENGDKLTPASLYGEARNLGEAEPLVFLNACHTGRGGMSLTDAGGWASKLLTLGAGAFIGTSWAVEDKPASVFAKHFYRYFIGGKPIGEAARLARLEIREEFPDDPTWLAYTVFAHPLALCREAPRSSEAPTPPEPPPESEGVADYPRTDESRGSEAPIPPEPPPEPEGVADSPRTDESKVKLTRRWRFSWSAAGLLIGLLVFLVLHRVRTGTHVQLDLTADHVSLTVGGEGRQWITNTSLGLRDLTLAGFSRLELYLSELTILSTEKDDSNGDPLPVAERVTLTAREANSYVNLEALTEEQGLLGTLNPVQTMPGAKVVLQTHPAGDGAIEIGLHITPAEQLNIPVPGTFRLEADFVDVAGIPSLSQSNGFFWQGRLSEPFIEIFSGTAGLELAMTVPGAEQTHILDQELPITAVEFFRQASDGERLTTLRSTGQLRFPDQPSQMPVMLRAEDFLVLEALRAFRLRGSRVDSASGHLHLLLEGIAGSVRVGPSGLGKEYSLSLYQKLPGPPWVWLISWLAGCVVLARGLERVWWRG